MSTRLHHIECSQGLHTIFKQIFANFIVDANMIRKLWPMGRGARQGAVWRVAILFLGFKSLSFRKYDDSEE